MKYIRLKKIKNSTYSIVICDSILKNKVVEKLGSYSNNNKLIINIFRLIYWLSKKNLIFMSGKVCILIEKFFIFNYLDKKYGDNEL
jgi:ribosomal protein S16